MTCVARLTAWLTRHPLKEPADYRPAEYTAQVMERVRALAQPAPRLALAAPRWLAWPAQAWVGPWPRLGLALATAVLVLIAVTLRRGDPGVQLASQIDDEARALLEVDERALDDLMLAETPQADEVWLEQTLQVLDETDEPFPAVDDDESLEEELRFLDELEHTTAS